MNSFNKNNSENLQSFFEGYEADFSPEEMAADWSQVGEKISAGNTVETPSQKGTGASGTGWIAGLVAGVAILGSVYFLSRTSTPEPEINKEIISSPEGQVVSLDNGDLGNAAQKEVNVALSLDDKDPKPVKSQEIAQADTQKRQGLSPSGTEGNQTIHSPSTDKADQNLPKKMKPSVSILSNSLCQGGAIDMKLKHAKAKNLYIYNFKSVKTNQVIDYGTISDRKRINTDIAGNFYLEVFEMKANRKVQLERFDIQVLEKPTAQIKIDKEPCGSYEFQSVLGAPENTWIIDNHRYAESNVHHQFEKVGYYPITLIATNGDCSDTATSAVHALSYTGSIGEIRTSNIFTPNGDGKNDYFCMLDLNPELQAIDGTLRIFNSENVEIFKTQKGLKERWNGRSSVDGRYCEPGTYRYVLSYADACSTEQANIKIGVILITR